MGTRMELGAPNPDPGPQAGHVGGTGSYLSSMGESGISTIAVLPDQGEQRQSHTDPCW